MKFIYKLLRLSYDLQLISTYGYIHNYNEIELLFHVVLKSFGRSIFFFDRLTLEIEHIIFKSLYKYTL